MVKTLLFFLYLQPRVYILRKKLSMQKLTFCVYNVEQFVFFDQKELTITNKFFITTIIFLFSNAMNL